MIRSGSGWSYNKITAKTPGELNFKVTIQLYLLPMEPSRQTLNINTECGYPGF